MDEDLKKQYSEIILYIRSERNGLAADLMKKSGLDYNMTYGVSSAIIKKKALEMSKNNQLARMLWNEDMRETKLFSFHLFNPETLSVDELREISKGFVNHELAEQACMNLIVHSPFAPQLAMEWAESSEQFVKMAAFSLVARLALLRKYEDERFYKQFFPFITEELDNSSSHIKRSIVSALLRMARISDDLKSDVKVFAQSIAESGHRSSAYVSQNVLAEIDYV